MANHSASSKSRAPRVKYVYVTPDGDDAPVDGQPLPRPKKVAEVSVTQRFRDVGLALTGVAASVCLILGSRVADYALEWHPGSIKQAPAVTTQAPAAQRQVLLSVPVQIVASPTKKG